MPFTSTADAQMLDALSNQSGVAPTNIVAFASLHTAYSATGLNEPTGGSPAYARKAITWSAAGGGSKSSSSSPVFDVPAGTTIAFVGLWSAATSGTFAGMGPNGGATQYAFTAATSGNTFTVPGSSYTVGQAVVLFPGAGATLPTSYAAGTIYYVITASGTAITLSAASGGTVLTVTAAGAGIIQAVTTEIYGAQGTFTLSSDTLTIV
jgi:hypothetical protein